MKLLYSTIACLIITLVFSGNVYSKERKYTLSVYYKNKRFPIKYQCNTVDIGDRYVTCNAGKKSKKFDRAFFESFHIKENNVFR